MGPRGILLRASRLLAPGPTQAQLCRLAFSGAPRSPTRPPEAEPAWVELAKVPTGTFP